MTQHYGFFNNQCNDIMHSLQCVYLLSSTASGRLESMKGNGTYMYKDNFRRSISLFSTRCLSKHSWVTDQDRYIGEPK